MEHNHFEWFLERRRVGFCGGEGGGICMCDMTPWPIEDKNHSHLFWQPVCLRPLLYYNHCSIDWQCNSTSYVSFSMSTVVSVMYVLVVLVCCAPGSRRCVMCVRLWMLSWAMQTLFLCSDKEARWVGVMAVNCGHRAVLVLVLEVVVCVCVCVCVMYNYRILYTCA